jgi:hypothetical protein
MISLVRLLVVLLAVAACGGKKAGDHPPAQIVDLTTSTAELTRDFDAHSGEARFVTTLSPA